MAGLATSAATWAQTAAPPAPEPAAASTQQIEVQAKRLDTTEERRRSTASKIIIGRDEIERLGDSTVGEILKRLPGVTVSGRPGRGGTPSLRGMGNGYTQILVDGERMPRGFSLDSIEPDQVERIEIIRAPTAETGARAIAGTINVVLREEFKRRQNDLRASVGSEQSRPRASASWTWGDRSDGMDYTLTGSARRSQSADASTQRTTGADASGTPTLDQTVQTTSGTWSDGASLGARLRWQAGRDRLELQPFVGHSQSRTTGRTLLQQTLGTQALPFASSDYVADNQGSQARLNGSWLHVTGDGGRLLLRLGALLSRSDGLTTALRRDAAGSDPHQRIEDSQLRDSSLTQSGRYAKLLADTHSFSAGWELQANQRTERRTLTDNGVPELGEFGDDVMAGTRRLALYAQDEWEASKRWAFNAGLRWEGIETRSDSALRAVRSTSQVLTPLLHVVWRPDGRPRDQVRVSLTRSYRTPTTAQLIARPNLSSLYPTSGANPPISPDRAGNPELRPETAQGLDVAVEHYLPAGGIFSANAYVRRISQLIRNVRSLQDVSWSPVQRWVLQPQNIGGALAAGLELEAKCRAADLWATTLPLTLRVNGSLMWSRVDGVAGPDNRLDQQPRYTANMGFDYAAQSLPLSWGANLNLTPAFTVRQLDAQVYEQGDKRVFDAYAAWRFGTLATLRLSLANAAPRDDASATTLTLDDGSTQRRDSLARTYLVSSLRLEMRY